MDETPAYQKCKQTADMLRHGKSPNQSIGASQRLLAALREAYPSMEEFQPVIAKFAQAIKDFKKAKEVGDETDPLVKAAIEIFT